MKKAKKVKRAPEEVARDALNVLRCKVEIEHNHWVSGTPLGGCPDCALNGLADEVAAPMDPEALAVQWDVSSAAIRAGLAHAAAMQVVSASPEIQEPEHEDLDSLGEDGQQVDRLSTLGT